MTGTHKVMDTTVPRPAPRFPLLPTPFTFEKPVALVPDLSLIFDSAASSPQQPRTSSKTTPTPSTPIANTSTNDINGKQPSSFEVQVLYDMMKKQEETISKMSEQIQSIIAYQSTQFNNVETMLIKLMTTTMTENLPVKVKTIEQSVQTDNNVQDNNVLVNASKSPQVSEKRVILAPSHPTAKVQMDDSSNNNNKLPNIERSRNSSDSSSSSVSVSSTNNNSRKDTTIDPNQSTSPYNSSSESNRMDNLSTILKDLQLPTIQETSLFSEASVQPLDLQDYNDSMDDSDLENHCIGPKSASAYGSSSNDEDIVQPTATFYRNVIGNVNRMLENNQQETTLYGSSDMTVYGMSSNNLSFATKQYLQKYGLITPKEKKKSNKKQHVNTPAKANKKVSIDELPHDNNNQVLDLTALKNQPKLL